MSNRNVGRDPNRLVVMSATVPAWMADKLKELAKQEETTRSEWLRDKLEELIKKVG